MVSKAITRTCPERKSCHMQLAHPPPNTLKSLSRVVFSNQVFSPLVPPRHLVFGLLSTNSVMRADHWGTPALAHATLWRNRWLPGRLASCCKASGIPFKESKDQFLPQALGL